MPRLGTAAGRAGEEGEPEGERLAGAGPSAAEHVAPGEEFGRVAPWIGKGSVTPWAVRVFVRAAGMSRASKDSTAGSAGVMVSGSENS